MGSERRDRFLKLERARPDGPEAPDPVPASATDRFREPPEPPPEPVRAGGVEQPYRRCAICQADSHRQATACSHCGSPLDTPEQRAFNERHWAERQAQDEAARRERNEREAAAQREAADLARQRREIGEQLARRERERVDAQFPDGPLGGGRLGRQDTTGMRLLRLLPGTGWRIAAACVLFGLPLLLLLFARGMPQLVGMILLGVVVTLFSPVRQRDRRW
jgi:hypothetical protein